MTVLRDIYLGINWLGHAALVSANHRLGICGICAAVTCMNRQVKSQYDD